MSPPLPICVDCGRAMSADEWDAIGRPLDNQARRDLYQTIGDAEWRCGCAGLAQFVWFLEVPSL